MKLQIDTKNKTIKVEEQVNLGQFINTLNQFFPNEEWKKFNLQTNVNINWTSPIIIDKHIPPYQYPWWNQPYATYSPNITLCNNPSDNQYVLSSGIFNVEIN